MNDRRVEISRHVPTDAIFVFVTWFLTYAMALSRQEDFKLSLGGIEFGSVVILCYGGMA